MSGVPVQLTRKASIASGPCAKPSVTARVSGSEVVLINMPWSSVDAPSIQCGLLGACAAEAGEDVRVEYRNLELYSILGRAVYERVLYFTSRVTTLLGEWLFGEAAFGRRGDDGTYLATMHGGAPPKDREALMELRRTILPEWIERVASHLAASAGVVCFTSTFEQNVASLALARALKQQRADIVTVFGGANFDGGMGVEYVRTLPWVDIAVLGEGDTVFPRLLNCLRDGRGLESLPGVCYRVDGGDVYSAPTTAPVPVEDLPVPDYDDFFEQRAALSRGASSLFRRPHLLYEAARGCWWGEKNHCTFCGLNHDNISFRSRSPQRVVEDLAYLADRYRCVEIDAVDNILDERYVEALHSYYEETGVSFRLFYEVKANLTRAQVRALSAAGIAEIQPGIESLSTRLLRLMRKGSNLLLNVRILKWARYYGLRVNWNMLMGLPGESDADYAEQVRVCGQLTHLAPPRSVGSIWLERYSPYFADREELFNNARPLSSYAAVYPGEIISLGDIAYFYEYDGLRCGGASPSSRREFEEAVARWQTAWHGGDPYLEYIKGPGWLEIIDARAAELRRVLLDGWQAAVYEAASDSPVPVTRLCSLASNMGGLVGQCEDFLQRVVDAGLMLREGQVVFAIALPRRRPRLAVPK